MAAKKKASKKIASKKSAAKPSKPAPKKTLAKPAADKTGEKKVHKAKSSLSAFCSDALREIDKKVGLSQGSARKTEPISTGSLAVDYTIGGGLFPGFYEFSGKKAAGKSTLAVNALASAITSGVPLNIIEDAEGSLTPDFTDNVLQAFDLGEVFRKGLVHYYDNRIIETWAAHLKGLVNALPRKVWSDDAGTWCYAVPKGAKTTVQMLANLKDGGLTPDKKLSGDKFWLLPTDYWGPEAFYVTDSLATMLPEGLMDDEVGRGNAAIARAFSEALPHFAGGLRSRGIILFGTNQIRVNPRAMFTDPEYSPGGHTLGHAFEVQVRMDSRAVPEGFSKDKDTGYLAIEPSVIQPGAYDRYAFKAVNNHKNKYGRPFMKSRIRITVADHTGTGRGIDPVFDCLTFMHESGQAKGIKKITLTPRPSAGKRIQMLAGKQIDYLDFKALVLGEHLNDRELLGRAMKKIGLSQPPHLREGLFAQMRKDKTLWSAESANTKNPKSKGAASAVPGDADADE